MYLLSVILLGGLIDALLELEDTAVRLKREKDTLRNTLNYLTAASAVKDAFPSSD